jgi:hypothetical protein
MYLIILLDIERVNQTRLSGFSSSSSITSI